MAELQDVQDEQHTFTCLKWQFLCNKNELLYLKIFYKAVIAHMTQQEKNVWWAFLLPLAAVLIWSFNMTVTRYVADFISPLSISFYRWLLAFLLLTPFILPKLIRQWPEVKPHLGQLAILSLFGMVLYQGLAYSAAHFTTATHMGLINAFIPIFTILMGVMILKIQPSKAAILGGILSLLGLSMVIIQGDWQHILAAKSSYIGDVLMLFAVLFYACYGIYLKKWSLKIGLMLSLYVQICWSLIFHLPFVMWQGLDVLNSQNLASVLYAGIFPSIFAPLCWMMAVQYLGPNRSSVFMNLMPIFTAIIAYVWLKEAWTIYHTVGTVIILFGIFLAQSGTIHAKPHTKND